MPKVSVVIPAYNTGAYICQAIQSVLDQTFDDFEIIVIDDGSTDDTAERLRRFEGQIKYVYQTNQERSAARNNGLAVAEGEYVAFLDADDVWLPHFLELQVAYLDAHPACGLCRTYSYDVDVNGQIVRVGSIRPKHEIPDGNMLAVLLVGNCMNNAAVVLARTDLVRAVGGFDIGLRQGEDWDLWLRLAAKSEVGTVSEPLVCYRRFNAFVPERMHGRDVENAYIRILDKAFGSLNDPELMSLEGSAYGRAYFLLAWINYALDDVERGQQFLELAAEAYPSFFKAPYDDIVTSIAYLADALYDLTTPMGEAVDSINGLFNSLPLSLERISHLRKRALGQYYGLCFFRSHEMGDSHGVLRTLPLALVGNPAWLKNRGFYSISARAAWAICRELVGSND